VPPVAVDQRTRSTWGWGFQDASFTRAQAREAAPGIVAALGFGRTDLEDPVPLEQVTLPAPRVDVPAAPLWDTSARARASHAHGQSYLDVVRSFRGVYEHVPDAVARPRDEQEVEAVLEWAAGAGAAVVPFGGGTSVVGGVEPRVGALWTGAISLDLGALDAVHEVDAVSGAARIGAGASGPRLEAQLRGHGLTLRFYPQSYELSTLGGWIATRAAGHFATGPTHVDDLVEAIRAVTPRGVWASRRLPASGAGPSPDRLLLGSEGILGVITEAWVRVRPRPSHRAARTVRFGSFARGAGAVRAIVQAGLEPAGCRLVDALEAQATGAGDGTHAVLVLGFESADRGVEPELRRALELCRTHGGVADKPREDGDAGASWREAFLRMPYLRDVLVRAGVLCDTFESAITWERFAAFHDAVIGAVREAIGEPSRVTCRFTHVYPDGPAPYFTVLAPARRGDEAGQWHEMKRAASEAILAAGGTITHHHAVGRDHRPWYDRQRPEPFAAALRAAKAAVDPMGMLNPGVLVGEGGW